MENDMFTYALLENDEETLEFLIVHEKSDGKEESKCLNKNSFNLDNFSEDECLQNFRFHKGKIILLFTSLKIPENIILENRTSFDGIEALCVLLRRLAYPNRLCDLVPFFGRHKTTLSLVIKFMINFLVCRYGHLLSSFDQTWMDENHLQMYADHIYSTGSPLQNVIGFIDGTVRPVCRPTINQKVCYNGHKRVHALKFQSVVLPNGIIANMFGPIEGRRHDCALLKMSEVVEKMARRDVRSRNGDAFALFGDPAYPINDYLLCPFKGANLRDGEKMFNKKMSAVRECVEWEFGKIISLFAFLDFKKNLKVFLQPVAKYYLVGALLTNCHTTIYGSQTSMYFGMEPPSLETYLGTNN